MSTRVELVRPERVSLVVETPQGNFDLPIRCDHLLVETPEPNLSAGMKWLQSTYTSRYNRRHRLLGHLFQGRYKAVVVESDNARYLQMVSPYIPLNPARSGLIAVGQEKLKRYGWSSYPWYVSRLAPVWLRRERVLGSLGLKPGQGRGYEAYLESRVSQAVSRMRHRPGRRLKALQRLLNGLEPANSSP